MAIYAFSFHSSVGTERLLKGILYFVKEDDLGLQEGGYQEPAVQPTRYQIFVELST